MIKLSEKYPEFFEYFKEKPIGVEDFSIKEGWYALLDKYLGLMYEHCQTTGIYCKISYIKEKFGGLDITMWDADDTIFNLIIEAGRESRHTCEFCSYPYAKQTSMKDVGWIWTICDRCYNESKHKRNI